MYQNQLVLTKPCNDVIKLVDKKLKGRIIFPEVPGLYLPHRYKPVIIPYQREYLIDTGESTISYMTYKDILENIDVLIDKKARIVDEVAGVLVTANPELLMSSPSQPIGILKMIEWTLNNQIDDTRAYRHHSIDVSRYKDVDYISQIDEYVDKYCRGDSGDIGYIIDVCFKPLVAYLSDILDIIRDDNWSMFDVSTIDDVVMLFNQGDYRIYQWMKSQDRKDY